MPSPRLPNLQLPVGPPLASPLVLGSFATQCLPVAISQEQESSKLHHVQGRGGAAGRGFGEGRRDQSSNGRQGFGG